MTSPAYPWYALLLVVIVALGARPAWLGVAAAGYLAQYAGDRGVRCDDPVVFPGYVTFCSFYDPFGNRLQMCSPAPAEAAL